MSRKMIIGGRWRRWIDFVFGVPLLWLLSKIVRRSAPAGPAAKLLVIKLAAMGDTILLVPVLRSLRQAQPGLTIHWLTSAVNDDLARTVPHVDQCWTFPGKSLRQFGRLIHALRRERFDVVIDFEQWARAAALMAWATGAPQRIGFDTPGQGRNFLYTSIGRKDGRRHEIDDFYALASSAFPVQVDRRLELWETEKGLDELRRRCPELMSTTPKPRVLLHPGCGADGTPREWPLERYGALGRWLQGTFQADLWISSGPEERWKADQLQKMIGGTGCNVGGELSWQATVSLVKRMDLIVSGNTGIMHIAAALTKPQVALHGPTDPRRWGPLNPRARVIQSSCPECPCLILGFEYHRLDQSCMEKISLESVQQAASELLPAAKTPRS